MGIPQYLPGTKLERLNVKKVTKSIVGSTKVQKIFTSPQSKKKILAATGVKL